LQPPKIFSDSAKQSPCLIHIIYRNRDSPPAIPSRNLNIIILFIPLSSAEARFYAPGSLLQSRRSDLAVHTNLLILIQFKSFKIVFWEYDFTFG